MTTFGTRFKALRTEKKLTQDKIAEIFFLNKSSISRYESDKQLPEPASLQKFADYFDVSIDYLMGVSDTRTNAAKGNKKLSNKAERDIGITLDNFRNELLSIKSGNSNSTILFHGKPIPKEGIDEILNSMRLGMELAEMRIALAKTNSQTQDDNKG